MLGEFLLNICDGENVVCFLGVDDGEFYILSCFYIDLCLEMGLLLLFFRSDDG